MDKNLINRIMNSNSTLGVNSKELIKQFMQAGINTDVFLVKELFENYRDWYLSELFIDEISLEDVEMVKSSCDLFCKIADEYVRTKDFTKAIQMSSFPVDLPIGPIREFYRFVVDYHPENPCLN